MPGSGREAGLALAQALRDEGDTVAALAVYQRLLTADPEDDAAYRGRALVLAEIGAATLAAGQARAWPQAFADHQREAIEGDAIAARVRWGATYPRRESARFEAMEDALAHADALAADAPRRTDWQATRLRVDRLVALNGLARHAEVVAGYRALHDDGVAVPAWALPTVADSMLALRQPQAALPVLVAALEAMPAHVDARILLGFALIETERFDAALPVFERLAAGQPAWPRRLGAGFGYENWDRYKADSNLALARSLAGDTAGAEASLRALARIAPSNASLQAALGGVLQQRGRAAAALERYDGALTLDPRTRGARLGRVGALTALQRHAEARRALAEVTARYRRDPQVARAEREFARSRGWQFELGASGGRSDARDGGTSASPLGAEDAALQVELASPLLADRWRVTASALARRADFDGARTRYRSAGVGIDYVHDRLHVAASAAHVLDADGGGPALRVAADWRVSDAWLGYAEARTRDPDGSMQARRLGIGADSVRAGLRFSRDDTLVVDARLGQLRYEDGNRREQFGLDASALVARRPHLRIDLLGAGYASRGRDRDVSYFNPRRDASAQLGLRIDHLGWRRYEREFRQRLEIGAGPYWQEGHGTHWVPTVAYRHAWRLGLGRVLDYGAAWSRPVYDGAREQRIMFDLGYRWGQP